MLCLLGLREAFGILEFLNAGLCRLLQRYQDIGVLIIVEVILTGLLNSFENHFEEECNCFTLKLLSKGNFLWRR